MESIWDLLASRPAFESLEGELKTDVLIIGGGIAGLLCGYMLENAGIDCAIVEANEICGGVTHNTTAKVTLQHGLIYDKILTKYGAENAQLYFQAQNEALKTYKDLSTKINCDFIECNSFVYSCNDRAKIEKEVSALNKIGCAAEFVEKPNLPFKTKGAVCVKNQAQFNPLMFISEISIEIYILL